MISAPDRRETLQLIEDAVAAGARRAQACAELGLSLRSLQRWQHCPEDRRPSAQRAEPANKLTPQERRRVLEVANQPEFASLPADSTTLGHSAHDHLDTRSMLTWTPDPRPLGQAVGAQRRRFALLV